MFDGTALKVDSKMGHIWTTDHNLSLLSLAAAAFLSAAEEIEKHHGSLYLWPRGGTLIGALRYGWNYFDVGFGLDYVDRDVEFSIAVDSNDHWSALALAFSQKLRQQGWAGCWAAWTYHHASDAQLDPDMLTRREFMPTLTCYYMHGQDGALFELRPMLRHSSGLKDSGTQVERPPPPPWGPGGMLNCVGI